MQGIFFTCLGLVYVNIYCQFKTCRIIIKSAIHHTALSHSVIIKRMFGSSLPRVVCMRAHVLFKLFGYSGVQQLCFSFVFLRLMYPMLPVSLDCSFLIASSVFSNVYIYIYMIRYFCSRIKR